MAKARAEALRPIPAELAGLIVLEGQNTGGYSGQVAHSGRVATIETVTNGEKTFYRARALSFFCAFSGDAFRHDIPDHDPDFAAVSAGVLAPPRLICFDCLGRVG